MTDEVRGLTAAVDELISRDPETRRDSVLEADIIGIARELNRLSAVLARDLVVFEDRSAFAHSGHRSLRSWMVDQLHWGKLSAGRLLKAARGAFYERRGFGTERFPTQLTETSQYWLEGKVSSEHVVQIVNLDTAICRGSEFPEDPQPRAARLAAERAFLAYALEEDAERLQEDLGPVRAQFAPEREALVSAADWEDRCLSLSAGMNGTGHLNATMSAEGRALGEAVLKAFGGKQGEEDTRTIKQRNHDALVRGFKLLHDAGYLAEPPSSPALALIPEQGADVVTLPEARPIAVMEVVAPIETLQQVYEVPASRYDGSPVPAPLARKLACDCSMSLLVLDQHRRVVQQTHRRGIPGWLRRRIRIRDRNRCQFPGCCNPIDDIHHLLEWAKGGLTEPRNLAGLCWFHHNLIHNEGWSLRGDPEQGSLEAIAPPHDDPLLSLRRIRRAQASFRPWMFRG